MRCSTKSDKPNQRVKVIRLGDIYIYPINLVSIQRISKNSKADARYELFKYLYKMWLVLFSPR